MARLGDIRRNTPSSVDGIWIRDLSIGELQALFPDPVDPDDEEENRARTLRMFRDLFCDASGERFEDVNEPEDIDRISVGVMQALIGDVEKMVSGVGKPSPETPDGE